MNWLQILVLAILGVSVLLSYYIFLKTDEKYEGYFDHPFWFGIQKNVVILLMIFQILAVFGFLISIGSWLIKPPKTGAVKDDNLFYALLLFFISAIIWPIGTKYNQYVISVISVVFTAAASIWLLAGSIEEEDNDLKFYRVLGLLLLSIVTVLGDAVLWNANYIIKNKEKF